MKIAKRSEAYKRYFFKFYKFNYISILINLLMRKGYKVKSYKLVFNFLKRIKLHFNFDPEQVIMYVFDNYRLLVQLIKKRKAGRIYNIPFFVDKMKGRLMILHFFLDSIKNRTENKLIDRLFLEFLELSKGYGRTVRKVEEYYTLAIRNYSFSYLLRKKKSNIYNKLQKYKK